MMSSEEYEGLKADIEAHGLIEPVLLCEGQILDGRNRYNACLELGIEPDYRIWDSDGSPAAYVASLNLHRRHLDASQRAMVGARLKEHFAEEAKQRKGARTDLVANLPPSEYGKSRDKAAETVNVSPRSVEHASKVIESGVPELSDAVDRGEVSVSAASEVAKLPPETPDR